MAESASITGSVIAPVDLTRANVAWLYSRRQLPMTLRVPATTCRYRLGVRTRGSQPRDRGSNPRTGTKNPNPKSQDPNPKGALESARLFLTGHLRHSRHSKERNYCGSAKTYTALAPLAVSASGVGA